MRPRPTLATIRFPAERTRLERMRRVLLRSTMPRLATALYAVWVALALVGQDATPCPTHDGPGAVAVAMAAMSPAMHMDAAAAHHAHGHASQHGAHHQCTCVGCGCCVAALDLGVRTHTLVPAPAAVVQVAATPRAPLRTDSSRAGRLLPFANAPPMMASDAVRA